MEKILIVATVTTLIFVLAKMAEMQFIEKEWKPLKFIIQDAVVVFVATVTSLLGYSLLNRSLGDFMSVVTDSKTANMASTEIFTDDPGF